MAETKTPKAESAPKKVSQAAQKVSEAAVKSAEAPKKASQAAKKPQQTIAGAAKPNGTEKRSTIGLRIGAIALWVLAIACEVFAIMALMQYFIPPFGMSMLVFLIIMIVLDMAFVILAAQLWKKANHINPMSEKRGKFLFYVWNELGVIMACICFIPLIILLLTNKNLDKKTKLIAVIAAIVALLISGAASADYNPISLEQKDEAESQLDGVTVYWTEFGHKYHLKFSQDGSEDTCCTYLRGKDPYFGTVTEAIEAGRTAICSYCARNYAEEMGLTLENLNVEGGVSTENKDAPAPGISINPGTAAPTATGGN